MSILPPEPSVEDLQIENAALRETITKLRVQVEKLRSALKSINTDAIGELTIRRALHDIEPTREELLKALETPADSCFFHHGALGERCSECGDVIDGRSKEQRRRMREEIVDCVNCVDEKKASP